MTTTISRAVDTLPIFVATGPRAITLRAGTTIGGNAFAADTPVSLPELVAGEDYAVSLADGLPVALPCADGVPDAAIGGFHFAPGGNATANKGGDDVPAINPYSIWDAGFRPASPDPRGMALISDLARPFWCDIYLLGVDHLVKGTSRCAETIADGVDHPNWPAAGKKADKLDYPTAVAIYAHHGKQLLGVEEFFAAAYGVTERSAARNEPQKTGLDAMRTSRFGLIQATGNLWVWGHDGHPDDPRPSIFGGSWIDGDYAGSRYAFLGNWPGLSDGDISARGRCDHLMPA